MGEKLWLLFSSSFWNVRISFPQINLTFIFNYISSIFFRLKEQNSKTHKHCRTKTKFELNLSSPRVYRFQYIRSRFLRGNITLFICFNSAFYKFLLHFFMIIVFSICIIHFSLNSVETKALSSASVAVLLVTTSHYATIIPVMDHKITFVLLYYDMYPIIITY